VYDYPSGKLVGRLTGFYDPRGMCVDKNGDVYISNYQYGLLIEYAHGGTNPVRICEDPSGSLVGCSISAAGDVSATATNEVCTWKGGIANDSPACIDGNSTSCIYFATFGYDHAGDLVGMGETNGSIVACMIPAGKTTMEKLSTSGITVNFDLEGTSWDGRYIALGAYQGNTSTYESDPSN
jgi:hypothetical protein